MSARTSEKQKASLRLADEKRKAGLWPAFAEHGSPRRTRTADPVINSHLLYRLSYRGVDCEPAMIFEAGGSVKGLQR